jgi:hypothetical protein
MAFQMPVASYVSTDVENPDQLLAHDSDSIRSIKVILDAGQNLKRGAVVGALTGSPTVYIFSLFGASDGSENPMGVLAQDCDATSGDKECLMYTGGSFNGHRVILGTGWTVDSIYEPLRKEGIYLEKNPVIAP